MRANWASPMRKWINFFICSWTSVTVPANVIEEGFDEKFVRLVLNRVRRNQFKRMMPPIAKVSNRTIGYDFLYLRDWGT